jgi:hypothetical protein
MENLPKFSKAQALKLSAAGTARHRISEKTVLAWHGTHLIDFNLIFSRLLS